MTRSFWDFQSGMGRHPALSARFWKAMISPAKPLCLSAPPTAAGLDQALQTSMHYARIEKSAAIVTRAGLRWRQPVWLKGKLLIPVFIAAGAIRKKSRNQRINFGQIQ